MVLLWSKHSSSATPLQLPAWYVCDEVHEMKSFAVYAALKIMGTSVFFESGTLSYHQYGQINGWRIRHWRCNGYAILPTVSSWMRAARERVCPFLFWVPYRQKHWWWIEGIAEYTQAARSRATSSFQAIQPAAFCIFNKERISMTLLE